MESGNRIDTDVVIFGGGVSGLWTLDVLRRAGYRCLLLESGRLGDGQTLQSQGIIHGGGKYALRGVGDLAAVAAIREMPRRWREHHGGRREPDLSSARLRSEICHLWLPGGSLASRLQAWGLVPLLARGGLLATRPRRLARDSWPAPLCGAALAVFAMEEPVFDTASLLLALARRHARCLLGYAPGEGARRIEWRRHPESGRVQAVGVEVPALSRRLEVATRTVVLAAGAGNADLLAASGSEAGWMQRRPLRMFLLRGRLPELHGHCIVGGRTRLTITSAGDAGARVWQVGGDVAEEAADDPDVTGRMRSLADELRRRLPAVDWRGVEMTSHPAQRAEGRHAGERRPSGVDVRRFAPNAWVAWPTKLALAPLLADEILDRVRAAVAPSTEADEVSIPETARPPVAAYPWEEAAWSAMP